MHNHSKIRQSILTYTLWLLAAAACVHQSNSRRLSEVTRNPRASDGELVFMLFTAEDALERAARALESSGFAIIATPTRRLIHVTVPRTIAGDTTMTITAEAFPVSDVPVKSVIVLTATFSSRAQRIKNRLVIDLGSGQTNIPWNTLTAVKKRLAGQAEKTPL